MIFWGCLIAGGVCINVAFMSKLPALAIVAGVLYAIAIAKGA
jgi:hypothetical protein